VCHKAIRSGLVAHAAKNFVALCATRPQRQTGISPTGRHQTWISATGKRQAGISALRSPRRDSPGRFGHQPRVRPRADDVPYSDDRRHRMTALVTDWSPVRDIQRAPVRGDRHRAESVAGQCHGRPVQQADRAGNWPRHTSDERQAVDDQHPESTPAVKAGTSCGAYAGKAPRSRTPGGCG